MIFSKTKKKKNTAGLLENYKLFSLPELGGTCRTVNNFWNYYGQLRSPLRRLYI